MKTTRQEREAWMNSDGDHLNRHAVHRLLEDFAELEAKLAACEWKPITETDLPKVGDEIGCYTGQVNRRWVFQGYVSFDGFKTYKEIQHFGWTHFRAINPPQQEG